MNLPGMLHRTIVTALAFAMLVAGAWAQSAAQSPYGKAERRDAIFLRFPEMARRFFEDSETKTASHNSVAVPMPRQCAFVYADAYTKGQMSEREVQETALSSCNHHLAELGPLGENYNVTCQCKLVISDGIYVVPRESLPDAAYGPASIFYRDNRGNVARLNGSARYGALIGHDRSVTFTVENVRAEAVCDGTFTNEASGSGRCAAEARGGCEASLGGVERGDGDPAARISSLQPLDSTWGRNRLDVCGAGGRFGIGEIAGGARGECG